MLVILDSRANSNFISTSLVRELSLKTKVKEVEYLVVTINRSSIRGDSRIIDLET